MQAVGAALRDNADYTTCAAPVLSIGGRGGDTKFFDGIVHLERNGLIGAGSNVVRAVEEKVVGTRPLAGDAEACAGKAGAGFDVVSVRAEQSKDEKVSVVQRK